MKKEEMRELLRARLGDNKDHPIVDYHGRVIDYNKAVRVFIDDDLDNFLTLAIKRLGLEGRELLGGREENNIVSWAYVYALMAQLPLEAGKEFAVHDGGTTIETAYVSPKLLDLIRVELDILRM